MRRPKLQQLDTISNKQLIKLTIATNGSCQVTWSKVGPSNNSTKIAASF